MRMYNRRRVIRLLAIWAATRRLLEPDTPMDELMFVDPARIDSSLLKTTPVDEFGAMGETTHRVDLADWRLEIGGAVQRPGSFTYEELLARPALERQALLVCPGFFAYNGLWKGFSVAALLGELGLDQGAGKVKFSGSTGLSRRTRSFRVEEVLADRVFIAYAVNDQPLPQRHGFPIRLVAPDHKGARWVKYLNRVTVVR